MASRILYEDDILDQGVNEIDLFKSNETTMVKFEDPVDGDVYSSYESQDSTMDTIESTRKKYSVLLDNVIILGSKGNTGNEISNTSQGKSKTSIYDGDGDGNSSQDEGNVSQDEVIEGTVTPVIKGKRRLKSELELLLLDSKRNEKDLDGKYDVFGDENKIFRRYKLRKNERIVSYTEPAGIRLKECHRTDKKTYLTCPVCKQVLENNVALLNHLQIHNKGAPQYTCPLCSMKFVRKADLKAHRQKHTVEPFLCQECKLAFSSYCDYLLHNYKHLNQPLFKCSECGLRYRKSVYKQHIMTHFENKLSCGVCSFVAKGPRHLQTHLNQHNKKFTCVECGKVCNCKSVFDYHMSVHTGVKKVQCLYCGACFRGRNSRDVHHRTHTGERPFTCDICGHKAQTLTNLQRHKQTHIAEKRYICDLCGKKFQRKEYLVLHKRSHTQERSYACPECDAKFICLKGLKSHLIFRHARERLVECAVCDKKFMNYNRYRKHCRAKYHLRNVYNNNKSASSNE